ncbi:hypothetical protein [Brevundimonas lenta]|uniref:Rap1a immunity protein domain-containing protein n=1 Tax=Brevundimonas lenta TaxID=424796 RepID=A0A7W6JCK3_9CAUL|nr:hypothetical protein [Brevundimonas lenta]MBB4082641.1 hypothetical protein [Brevundimonas lenta]
MKRIALVAGLALALALFATAAEAMTVRQFLTVAQTLPQNATMMLHPEGRRLVSEVTGAVSALKAEQAADIAAGRRPAHCIPSSGTGISPEALMARLNAIPASRRDISVLQALREWMAERYPCPS